MPTPYNPVGRRSNVIGGNIRPGFTPGGFSHQFGAGKTNPRRKIKGSIASFEVKEAASAVLERRGFINQPNAYDGQVRIDPPRTGTEITIAWPPK